MLGMVARAGMPIAAVRGNRMKCHVLVISGPSGTGKSTITQEMLKRAASAGISTSAIHQDSYFIGPKPDSYWTQAPKESPDTVDMPALRAAIAAAIADETNELLMVEGFLLLQDEPIMAKVDAVMFLTCDQETCLGRRLSRSKRTAHESEGLKVYYAQHVWPGFLAHTKPALDALRAAAATSVSGCPRLSEIDSTDDFDRVLSNALSALPRLLGPRFAIQ